MLEMEMINAPGAGASLVPVPILGRAVLFVGSDGVMRARLPDGSFVIAVGAQGAPGVAGAQGAPGLLSSRHTATLGQARPGLDTGLLLHEFPLSVSMIGRVVRARGLLSVSSAGIQNVSFLLNVGGLVFEFPVFTSNGARLIRFDVDVHVQTAAAGDGGILQGNAALTGAAAMTYARRVSVAGAVASSLVQFSIKGALAAVTVLAASIEVV